MKVVTAARTAVEDVKDEKSIVEVRSMTGTQMMTQVAAAMKVGEGGSATRKINKESERIRKRRLQSLKMMTTSTSCHPFSTNPTNFKTVFWILIIA
jgi:hypothetical protein